MGRYRAGTVEANHAAVERIGADEVDVRWLLDRLWQERKQLETDIEAITGGIVSRQVRHGRIGAVGAPTRPACSPQ
jgi:hypothetical protein